MAHSRDTASFAAAADPAANAPDSVAETAIERDVVVVRAVVVAEVQNSAVVATPRGNDSSAAVARTAIVFDVANPAGRAPCLAVDDAVAPIAAVLHYDDAIRSVDRDVDSDPNPVALVIAIVSVVPNAAGLLTGCAAVAALAADVAVPNAVDVPGIAGFVLVSAAQHPVGLRPGAADPAAAAVPNAAGGPGIVGFVLVSAVRPAVGLRPGVADPAAAAVPNAVDGLEIDFDAEHFRFVVAPDVRGRGSALATEFVPLIVEAAVLVGSHHARAGPVH